MPGRASNQVRDRLRELTVTPASVFQGDASSKVRFRQTAELIAGEISRLNDLLRNPEGLRAKELSLARKNVSELTGLLQEYDVILRNFEGNAPLSEAEARQLEQLRQQQSAPQ